MPPFCATAPVISGVVTTPAVWVRSFAAVPLSILPAVTLPETTSAALFSVIVPPLAVLAPVKAIVFAPALSVISPPAPVLPELVSSPLTESAAAEGAVTRFRESAVPLTASMTLAVDLRSTSLAPVSTSEGAFTTAPTVWSACPLSVSVVALIVPFFWSRVAISTVLSGTPAARAPSSAVFVGFSSCVNFPPIVTLFPEPANMYPDSWVTSPFISRSPAEVIMPPPLWVSFAPVVLLSIVPAVIEPASVCSAALFSVIVPPLAVLAPVKAIVFAPALSVISPPAPELPELVSRPLTESVAAEGAVTKFRESAVPLTASMTLAVDLRSTSLAPVSTSEGAFTTAPSSWSAWPLSVNVVALIVPFFWSRVAISTSLIGTPVSRSPRTAVLVSA